MVIKNTKNKRKENKNLSGNYNKTDEYGKNSRNSVSAREVGFQRIFIICVVAADRVIMIKVIMIKSAK